MAPMDRDIAAAKLRALVAGAALARRKTWDGAVEGGTGTGGGADAAHSRSMSVVSRSIRPPRSTSNMSCQSPGMWKSRPSAT